jgi:hypothetical protein
MKVFSRPTNDDGCCKSVRLIISTQKYPNKQTYNKPNNQISKITTTFLQMQIHYFNKSDTI